MDHTVTFKIPVIEGPLDLLLYLLSKNKVEIADIPVAMILEQYMEHLAEMSRMDMEIASEFIVMAAQLILIKSRMLLPKQVVEEEEDPREELVRSLLEYQRFKEASTFLKERSAYGTDLICREQQPLEVPKTYQYQHDAEELRKAMKALRERMRQMRPPSQENFAGIVGIEPVPVEKKVQEILQKLVRSQEVSFHAIFRGAESKSEVIAIFLAVLELLNTKRVQPVEHGEECMLVLDRGAGKEEAYANVNGTTYVS